LLARVPADADAESLYEKLKASGILVRYFATPRLRDSLRITVGTPEQNAQLLSLLETLLKN
jgi:histidinol-phosphate aminotransferase